MPVLNEAAAIQDRLAALAPLRDDGAEVLVVDGGSTDHTCGLAARNADLIIHSPRGRGLQMNAGAAAARGAVLLFLHADTRLPETALADIRCALADTRRSWGRFDVAMEGRHPLLPVVAFMTNVRSRLTGIATGDQAIFIRRATFEAVGGFRPLALMEDIALSSALRRLSAPACLETRVTTSGRRWDERGFWRTVLLMWSLRAAFALGVPPRILARLYGYG